MNPVLQFLQTHDGYSFEEGVAVLLSYSSNAFTNRMIMCRRDRRHLATELSRLAHIPNLKALPGREEVETKVPKTETIEPKTETIEPKSEIIEPKSETIEPKSDESSQNEGTDDESDIVTYLDLKRYEKYDPDKLPPTLKELWLKNSDEYKELKYCHAQMKEANSDAGRADWRKQLFDHRASLQKRWKLFEEEKARLEEEARPTEPKEYNPFNDRSYIAKALKKDKWSDEMKLEVQKRTNALLGHNIPIKDETLQRLKERGISI